MTELNETTGKILIVATLMFLLGLTLSILGMIGIINERLTIVGSVLIFAALGLRIVSTLKS